jgi:hypothetical protein
MAELHGLVHDLPESLYHSHQALSSTEARILLRPGGPARYRWAKDNPPLVKPSRKFDVGSCAHTLVLGAGSEVVIVEAPDWRTKAAREERDEARAAGKAPVLRHEYEAVKGMAEGALANRTVRALFEQPGHPEVSAFATDPETGIETRARFDWLPELTLPRPVAFDLKTFARDATTDAFGRAVVDYGYHVQEDWYRWTLDHSGAQGNRPEFVFCVVEKEPPYLAAVFQMPVVLREKAAAKTARARRLFAECLDRVKRGVEPAWPGLSDDVQFVDVPNWVMYEDEEQAA